MNEKILENLACVVFHSPLKNFKMYFTGTKWCGTGDIATNYYDLGSEVVVDKCCRAHDICPVKVLGYAKKYELYNDSFITM